MYSRFITPEITRILKQKSLLLLGPRQVGKSTLLKSLKPLLHINLSDEETFQRHLKDPALLKRQLNAITPDRATSFILIDEIQRIPSLLNTVQSLVDDSPHFRFALTGSSARKLKRGQANLLPGRIIGRALAPLTYWELAHEWSPALLNKSLKLGGLPGVLTADTSIANELLESYAQIYLREEIQSEALTKDLGDYSRFLDIAAELSGQHLNYSKIASDSEINKEKIRRYIEILQDTLLIRRIESYTHVDSRRKARQKDKFYFFDLGVRNALLGKHSSHMTPTEMGPLFESWVILQLLALQDYSRPSWRIYSYRDDRNLEVDLIIESESHLHICEIKYQNKYRSDFEKNLIGFEQITRSKKKIKKYIVYCGDEKQKTNHGTLVIPYTDFLQKIKSPAFDASS